MSPRLSSIGIFPLLLIVSVAFSFVQAQQNTVPQKDTLSGQLKIVDPYQESAQSLQDTSEPKVTPPPRQVALWDSTPFPGIDTLSLHISYYTPTALEQSQKRSPRVKTVYTYYLDSAGKQVVHGLKQYYGALGKLSSERMFKDGKKHGFSRVYYNTGQLSHEFHYVRNRVEGLERSFYPDGTQKHQVNFKWNKEHGPAQWWDKDGNLSTETRYHYGKIHGRYTKYFASGGPKVISNYHHGKRQGWEREFDYRGNKIRETRYKDEQKHGVEKLWWDRQTLKKSAKYRKGKFHGWYKEWNEYGVMTRKGFYRHGEVMQMVELEPVIAPDFDIALNELGPENLKPPSDSIKALPDSVQVDSITSKTEIVALATEAPVDSTIEKVIPKIQHKPLQKDGVYKLYDDAGNLKSETEIKDGMWQGEHRLWRKGKLFISLFYKNDTLHGDAKMYYTNGQVKETIPYENGSINGNVHTWYPTGEVKGKYKYRKGKRIGKAEGWYPDGSKRFIASYIGNNKNGKQKNWYPNGQLKSEINWILGELHGTKTLWNEQGEILTRSLFADNKCISGDCDLEDEESTRDQFDVE